MAGRQAPGPAGHAPLPELTGPPPPPGVADLPERYNAATDLLNEDAGGRDGTALVFVDGSEPVAASTVSYHELTDRASRLGPLLDELDVHPEERVVLLSDDRPEWVTVYLGALRAGRVVVPVSTLLQPRLVSELITLVRPRLICCDVERRATVEAIVPGLPQRPRVVVLDQPGGGLHHRLDGLDQMGPAPTRRDEPALILFTSGTTGPSRGAVHSHQDIAAARCFGAVMDYRPHDRIWATSKLFFAFAVGSALSTGLFAGASVVLHEGRVTPGRIVEVLRATHPTVVNTVPTVLSRLLDTDPPRETFVSLRAIVSAGERLAPPLLRRIVDRTGVEVLEHIGSTEYIHPFAATRPGEVEPGSTGTVMPGVDALVLGSDGPVPPGEEGDLWVRGCSVMDGYLHQRRATREVLHGPWLRTGDRVSADAAGRLTVAGRSDEMFLVSGMKVSPFEVEDALRTHAAVRDCAVVGAEDPEGLTACWAYVVPAEGRAPDGQLVADLAEHVRDQLPGYARPREIRFVGELPRTVTGKLQRYKLAQSARDELAGVSPA